MSYLLCGIGGALIGLATEQGVRFWVGLAGGLILYAGGVMTGATP